MVEHYVHMENKNKIEISEVLSVESFDSEEISINLKEEMLIIGGDNLHIQELDLERGTLTASGEISSIVYDKMKMKRRLRERFRR